MAELTLLNHSSLIIKSSGRYLLTDPWYHKPAFTSWLPIFPSYIHPTYYTSLLDKISILISHAHDDHCDHEVLNLFPKNTEFIITKFPGNSLYKRLKSLGFNNINALPGDGSGEYNVQNKFFIRSFMQDAFSDDDALYTIRNDDGLVIHANDCWPPIKEKNLKIIKNEINKTQTKKAYIFSQTNSATGYPIAYTQLSVEERKSLYREKVGYMVEGALTNFKNLELNGMFSYAGFARPYVESKDFSELISFTTSKYLNEEYLSKSKFKFEDFYPGDILELKNGLITKAFISSDDYEDKNFKESSNKFYKNYGLIEKTKIIKKYSNQTTTLEELVWFLEQFKSFVVNIIKKKTLRDSYSELEKKSFGITLKDKNISYAVSFLNEEINNEGKITKICLVDSAIFKGVLLGEILFESLYVGYLAEWHRNPVEKYNKDLVMICIMFTYFYQNVLVKEYKSKFHDSAENKNLNNLISN